jgi:serine protease Do
MSPKHNRFLRDYLPGVNLTFIVLFFASAVLVAFLNRGAISPVVLAQDSSHDKALGGSDIVALQTLNKAFERIARQVTPAIVSIQSTQVIKPRMSPLVPQAFDSPDQGSHPEQEHALGSGVLVTSDGYILTNNHVIQDASSIKVMLTDKRTFTGKVVGADPQTDVAVVKIDGTGLPTAALGNSSNLFVGDIVMAFGNPYGLNFTVTRGAVSALNRSEGAIEDIQNFIQTDAPINPGNSGGALVDVQGEVVGINTAILSGDSGPGEGGGSVGIGFAIPINMARHVMDDLVKTGGVRRGYLGAHIQTLDEGLARAFGIPDTSGALVEDVPPGGPADKAGLKNGDVIRKCNGQVVTDSGQLIALVTESKPGTVATFDVLRSGKPLTLQVTLGERPSALGIHASLGKPPSQGTLEGVSVQYITPDLREQLGLPPGTQGVVISNLDPASPAAESGIRPGDVIESINRQPVKSVADFERMAAEAKGDTLLRINHQGNGVFIVISPTQEESGNQQ